MSEQVEAFERARARAVAHLDAAIDAVRENPRTLPFPDIEGESRRELAAQLRDVANKLDPPDHAWMTKNRVVVSVYEGTKIVVQRSFNLGVGETHYVDNVGEDGNTHLIVTGQ